MRTLGKIISVPPIGPRVRRYPLRLRRRWFLAGAVRWGPPPTSSLLGRPAGSVGRGRFLRPGAGCRLGRAPSTKPAVTGAPSSTAGPGRKGTNGALLGRGFSTKVVVVGTGV